jgi:hypothetical protein
MGRDQKGMDFLLFYYSFIQYLLLKAHNDFGNIPGTGSEPKGRKRQESRPR